MKKIIKSITLFLVVILYFNTGLDQANAYYACGTYTIKCADVDMVYGESQYVASASVYFNYGEKIAYEWDNDSPGIQHVAFYVSRSGVRASKALTAPRDSNNWGVMDVTQAGWYYLFAACAGGDDTRCQGGGRISKY